MARRFDSFEEFFPWYVAMHRRPGTRWLHLAGTVGGAAVAVTGLVRGRPRRLVAFPLLGYGLAWPSHFLLEGNNPATFGHAAWSLRGDLAMILMMLTGHDADLQDIADTWLRQHAGEAGVPEPVRPPAVIDLDPTITLPA